MEESSRAHLKLGRLKAMDVKNALMRSMDVGGLKSADYLLAKVELRHYGAE